MISETYFASHYPSVWRTIAPSMEDFVRRWNMDGYEREWPPLSSTSEPSRRGIINEAGFLLFADICNLSIEESRSVMRSETQKAFDAASAYVLGMKGVDEVSDTSDSDKKEAVALAGRLHTFFRGYVENEGVSTSPAFKGNGILSNCKGDVLVGSNRLFEIKSGNRAFRSVDYRQLCVYLALNFAENGRVFSDLSLVNPRTGIYLVVDSETFAREISGRSAVSFCQSLIECFSANLVSE